MNNISGQGQTDMGLNQRPGINLDDHVDGVLSSEKSHLQSRVLPPNSHGLVHIDRYFSNFFTCKKSAIY